MASSSKMPSYSQKNNFFSFNRNVFLKQSTKSKINNSTNILKTLLLSLKDIPDYIETKKDELITEEVFAVFSVYVTFIDDTFKLIINNFGNGFFYNDKVYKFDLSHYTNFGHIIEFSTNNLLENKYQIIRYGIPGTSGSYVKLKPKNNDLIYIYTTLQGLSSGSFYNPISTLPNTDLPVNYTTITVNVEFINNGYKFVFDNYSEYILSINKQFKFDVSNPSNSGFYLKFSKDNTSKQAYNTISIGTPGTKNACVYFYTQTITSIYIFDPIIGYSVGDLYNPLFTYDENIVDYIENDILVNKDIINGTNSHFGKGISLNNTKIAITHSNNSWKLYDISKQTFDIYDISMTNMANLFKKKLDNILYNNYQKIIDDFSEDPINILKKNINLENDNTLLNILLKNISTIDDLYSFSYDTLFIKFPNNIYIHDNDVLLACSNINNIYSIFKYSYNGITYVLNNYYETNSLYFGNSIAKFNNEYICGAYGSDLIYRFDMSLNFISSFEYVSNSHFGKEIVCNDDFLFVTAPEYNNSEGIVMCYNKDFVNIQKIIIKDSIKLGTSISLNKFNKLVVSSKNVVYEYLYYDEKFKKTHVFYPPETTKYDISGTSIYENFGNKVLIDNYDYIYISSSYLDYKTGIVYLYKRRYNNQTLIQRITPIDKINDNQFGDFITSDDNYFLIYSKSNYGQIHIYNRKFETINEYNQSQEIVEDISKTDIKYTDLGADVTKLVGSIMFEPSDALVDNVDSNLIISIWSKAPENLPLPSIDITVKKTITVFYDLINENVLDNSNNEAKLSLLDVIQLYRNGKFESLINIFSSTNNSYSIMLGIINDTAIAAKNKTEQIYFKDKTEGVYISTQEYNIFNNYISSLHKTIDGIINGIDLYNNFTALQANVAIHKISYDILNDTSKLIEFIKSKNKHRVLSGLDVITTLNIDPKLHSHIEKYVSLYGWPDNFIFDSELMASILVDQNI